jgi:hypothetical protein
MKFVAACVTAFVILLGSQLSHAGSICSDGWISPTSGSGSCSYHGGIAGGRTGSPSRSVITGIPSTIPLSELWVTQRYVHPDDPGEILRQAGTDDFNLDDELGPPFAVEEHAEKCQIVCFDSMACKELWWKHSQVVDEINSLIRQHNQIILDQRNDFSCDALCKGRFDMAEKALNIRYRVIDEYNRKLMVDSQIHYAVR